MAIGRSEKIGVDACIASTPVQSVVPQSVNQITADAADELRLVLLITFYFP